MSITILRPAAYVAAFGELPLGACFINPLWSDRQLRRDYGPAAWEEHFISLKRLCGSHIKVGEYAFRDGSHGEDAQYWRGDKLVIAGRTIIALGLKDDPASSSEFCLLRAMFALSPLTIDYRALTAVHPPSPAAGPARLQALQADIRALTGLKYLYVTPSAKYRLTGLGVRQALRLGFSPYHADR